MNAYQQKWIDVLNHSNIKDWMASAQDDDILVNVPSGNSVKSIMENLPDVIATLSLDITEAKERVKFILYNDSERHEYILNPTENDLNAGDNK